MRMQVCCKSLALPTRATEPPRCCNPRYYAPDENDIAAASADAVASPAALRLRQPPQEAANLYSIHASVIDHALPRIASPRLASPAGRLSRHTTRATASPSYATHVRVHTTSPKPARPHAHTHSPCPCTESHIIDLCVVLPLDGAPCHASQSAVLCSLLPLPASSLFSQQAGSLPLCPRLSLPRRILPGSGSGSRVVGCLAASLPRSLTRYCTRSRSSSGTRSERGPLNGLRPPSGPNVPPPRCVRRRPCACAAPLDPLPMSDELSNNRPASRPTRYAAAALSLRPPRCVPRPLTGLACRGQLPCPPAQAALHTVQLPRHRPGNLVGPRVRAPTRQGSLYYSFHLGNENRRVKDLVLFSSYCAGMLYSAPYADCCISRRLSVCRL